MIKLFDFNNINDGAISIYNIFSKHIKLPINEEEIRATINLFRESKLGLEVFAEEVVE